MLIKEMQQQIYVGDKLIGLKFQPVWKMMATWINHYFNKVSNGRCKVYAGLHRPPQASTDRERLGWHHCTAFTAELLKYS